MSELLRVGDAVSIAPALAVRVDHDDVVSRSQFVVAHTCRHGLCVAAAAVEDEVHLALRGLARIRDIEVAIVSKSAVFEGPVGRNELLLIELDQLT